VLQLFVLFLKRKQNYDLLQKRRVQDIKQVISSFDWLTGNQ
jgi:hypothetical protein